MEIHFYPFYKYFIFFGCVFAICYFVNAKMPINFTFIINFSLVITMLFILFDIVTKVINNAKMSDTINISIDKYTNLEEPIDHFDKQNNTQADKIIDELLILNKEKN